MTRKLDQDIGEAQAAFNEWRETPVLGDEVLVCECFCVDVGEIRRSMEPGKEVDWCALQERLQLGSGCGTCWKRKDEWEAAIRKAGP